MLATLDHRLAVACAAIAATALGALLIWSPWLAPPPGLVGFDGRLIPAATNDASAQARVQRYQVFLGGLALLALAILAAPKGRAVAAPPAAAASRWPRSATSAAAAVLIVGALARWIAPEMPARSRIVPFAGFYAFFTLPSFWFHLAAALVALAALPLVVRLAPRLSLRVWWGALTAYTLAVTLPGLLEPIVLSHAPPGMLQSIEWHFDSVLGGTYTLAAASAERPIGYTYLLSLVLALVERHTGYFSFAADIRLVQVINVVFALAVVWACHAWDRARPVIGLVTLALVLPWVQNNHLNIFFPNQSGVRFLFFPLAIVLFRRSHRAPLRRAAVAWGAFAALALAWNLETGLAVAAGIVVHLGARAERLTPASLAPPFAAFAAGLAAGFVAVGLFSVAVLGRLAFGVPRRLVERTATGYGYGYPLYLDPAALLIFGYAIWAVLALVTARRAGAVAPRTADRGALGVVALVWAAYYVLQPHPWNVWSYLPLGGILLADSLVPERGDGASPARGFDVPAVPLVLAALIAAPAAGVGTWQTWWSIERGTHLSAVAAFEADRIARAVSGVVLAAGDARAVEPRAAYLATVPAGALVISGNSYLLPKLTGRVDLFPYRDPAYSATLQGQFASLASAIRARAPSPLLLDDPATLGRDDVHRRTFERLQAALADRYRPERLTSGWAIFTKD